MKMYDKNGNLTPVAQAIFNSGMERLRNGEDTLSIAQDLKAQVKLVKYEGEFLYNGQLTELASGLAKVANAYYWSKMFAPIIKSIKETELFKTELRKKLDEWANKGAPIILPETKKPNFIHDFWLFPRKPKGPIIVGDVNPA